MLSESRAQSSWPVVFGPEFEPLLNKRESSTSSPATRPSAAQRFYSIPLLICLCPELQLS